MTKYERQTIQGMLMWPPEMRFTPMGKAVIVFSIDFDGKKGADCEAWEALAERMAGDERMVPGRYLELRGYYKTVTWNDRKDGKKHQKQVFVVEWGKPLSIEQGVLNILLKCTVNRPHNQTECNGQHLDLSDT